MPRASTRATLDVRPRCELYSSLRRPDRIGAPKNTARTIIARMRTAQTIMARMRTGPTNTVPTNIAQKSTILMNIDPTWERETTSLYRTQEIE